MPRFIIPSAKELQEQYSGAIDAAQEYNKSGISSLNGLTARIKILRDSVFTVLLTFNDAFSNAINLTDNIDSVKAIVKPLVDQGDTLVDDMSELKKPITDLISSSNLMSIAPTALGQILTLWQKVQVDLKQLLSMYKSTLQAVQQNLKAAEKSKLDSLTAIMNKNNASLSALTGDVSTLISVVERWMQLDVPKQTEANLEFTDQVKQLLIDDVPNYTEVDLRYSGSRKPGDQVFLKAELECENGGASMPSNSVELERRTLTMFQVNAHAKLAAGVIFLSPFQKSKVAFTKQFQAAPSYNFIAKWGSRSSYACNTFWNFGIGMSVAAPDFNLDGTPEIGYGIVLSTANDCLQGGIGRNFGVETWYWFFGLQLPVGTVINPTTTLSTEK